MMAAYRLRGLGWFASCAGIVLSFYLVSLQVAGERNKLGALNGRIRAAERDIRALETEFDTRANLQQLEKWNGDILALSAPVANQFVGDERQLASALYRVPVASGGEGEVKTAALVVPSLPVAPEPQPVQVATAAPQSRAAPAVADASATSTAAKAAPAARSVARLQRVAMLDGDFLADLKSAARAEASR